MWRRGGGYLPGYNFKGRAKRNAGAFREADARENRRVRVVPTRVVATTRGVGVPAGTTDVARVTKATQGTREKAQRSGAPADMTNVAREETAAAETTRSQEARRDAARSSETRGSDKLKYISRAGSVGGGLGGFVTLRDWNVAASVAALTSMKSGKDNAGVEFEKILTEIFERSKTSASREKFVDWVATSAPMYPALNVGETTFVDVSEIASHREFVRVTEGGEREWRSPLNAAESSFARKTYNAVIAAAKALDASEDELCEAFKRAEREASLSLGHYRYLNVRGLYVWAISHEDLTYVYVGESLDLEQRISTHLVAIFDAEDGDGSLQRGHAVARNVGEDDTFRAWALIGHDEASAITLAKSYVDFFPNIPGTKVDAIMECARAIAGAGFAAEAVYTACFGSLHKEGTIVGGRRRT